jgi:transcriptional regulator with XRE-family HTH domain
MELKHRLALARGYAGLSREDLAARAGLSSSDTVAKLEQGSRTSPGYRTVAGLARALCVPVEWLGEGLGPDPDPKAVRGAVEAAHTANDNAAPAVPPAAPQVAA